MPVAPHNQQFYIKELRTIIKEVDQVAKRAGLTRMDLYAIAIRKLLKDPAGIITEIMADRMKSAEERV